MKRLENFNKVLVTGAAGFIGRRLMARLVHEGYCVTGAVLPSEYEAAEDRSNLSGVDLSILNNLIEYLSLYDFDIVIHCASQQPRRQCTLDDYYKGNVVLLNNVLDFMKENGTYNIITYSSSTVYGSSGKEMIDETSPVNPMNYYSISKWMGEQVLKYRTSVDNLGSVCFRLPSVFGPEQKGGLINTYYESASKNEELEVYSNGGLLRSIIHVDDVVEVTMTAVKALRYVIGHNLYLLGSSNIKTTGEIAQYIVDRLQSKSVVNMVDTPAPVDFHWNISTDKVQKELKFNPVSIEDSIDRYISEMKAAAALRGRRT